MTREEALAECVFLARKHPDRETASWQPQQQESGEWAVVKLPGKPPSPSREEPRPDPSEDVPQEPRTHGGFGFG